MKKLHYIFIIVILLVCLVPSVLMIAGFKNPNRENRVLAKLPKLVTDEGLNRSFASQIDSYTEDHFGLRDWLVSAFNRLDVAVLKDFNGTNAVIGKENHIFYGETVNDYLGIELMTDEDIEAAADYLLDLQNELKEQGTAFAFMTAPNKATIYPELMPDYLKPVSGERNIDRLKAALERRGVGHVDAKSVLLEAKNERSVYYEHDSHWNNFGAMLVYNETAGLFGLERFDARTYTTVNDRTGDLHNFVYPDSDYPEERIVYPEFHAWKSKRPIDFDRDKTLETSSNANDITMVVFHDSFGRSLQPILSQSVGKLFMNSYFPYNKDFIYKNSPDIVLIELVERNLPRLAEHARSLGY